MRNESRPRRARQIAMCRRLSACLWFGFLGSACSSPDLPNSRVWNSGHIRYHTRAEDPVCEAVVKTVELQTNEAFRRFGLQVPDDFTIDYYKYLDASDLDGAAVCPARAAACTNGSLILSGAAVDRHELTHAAFSLLGPAHRFLEEGIAVASACTVPAVAPSLELPEWDAAFATSYDDLDFKGYTLAGHFVGYLVNEFGPEAFKQLYQLVPRDAPAASIAAAVEMTYGTDIRAVWARAAAAPVEQGCLRWFECHGPSLALSTWRTLGLACDASDTYQTFLARADQLYSFQAAPPSDAQLLACDPMMPAPELSNLSQANTIVSPLQAQQYFVGAPAVGWTVRVDELGPLPSTCAMAPIIGLNGAVYEGGATVYASSTAPEWVRFAGLDLLGRFEVVVPDGVRVRSCRGCNADCRDLSGGGVLDGEAELVFELDASAAKPGARWFKLKSTE